LGYHGSNGLGFRGPGSIMPASIFLWFSGAGFDLANGSWTALMVKSRPQREMVATIFFFSGLFIFGLFLIHEFFSDFFMGFSFYFSTFVINSNFLGFFF
jgi:hypothetical protein